MSVEDRFEAAVYIVQNLPKEGPVKTSNDRRLNFYSLYKQATIGKVNTEQPSFFHFVERSKWDAWNALGDMPREEAKEKYVEALQSMFDEVAKTVDVLKWLTDSNKDPELPKKFALFMKT
ncbi:hypothetical protein AB6A40_010916 [Gnathostoma spinigerum]|uniref:ACB domain-containing protein n=1 Tax=Gnathostoma spinigerum TaxID=75299 RepID=A0ABD6EYN9_9BILA